MTWAQPCAGREIHSFSADHEPRLTHKRCDSASATFPTTSAWIGDALFGIERADTRPVLTVWLAGTPIPWMLNPHTASWPDTVRTAWTRGFGLDAAMGLGSVVAGLAVAAAVRVVLASRGGLLAALAVGLWLVGDPVTLTLRRTMEWQGALQTLVLAGLLLVTPTLWRQGRGALAVGC